MGYLRCFHTCEWSDFGTALHLVHSQGAKMGLGWQAGQRESGTASGMRNFWHSYNTTTKARHAQPECASMQAGQLQCDSIKP